jgi:hypothetical protein
MNIYPLIFVPLLALLPRKYTLKRRPQLGSSKLESERLWAVRFPAVLDGSNTEEILQHYPQMQITNPPPQ